MISAGTGLLFGFAGSNPALHMGPSAALKSATAGLGMRGTLRALGGSAETQAGMFAGQAIGTFNNLANSALASAFGETCP
jgi:hypothetical protein